MDGKRTGTEYEASETSTDAWNIDARRFISMYVYLYTHTSTHTYA